MRFNYKEIPDYKFVFKNGIEIVLNTIRRESFQICEKNVLLQITDALFNGDLIMNLTQNDLKEVIRIVEARDENSGKDFNIEYVMISPSCNYCEITSAEDTEYHEAHYSIHLPYFERTSDQKFEIRKNL